MTHPLIKKNVFHILNCSLCHTLALLSFEVLFAVEVIVRASLALFILEVEKTHRNGVSQGL